jgi:FSR family fosmidomycin resistance protein-like MFS transporter
MQSAATDGTEALRTTARRAPTTIAPCADRGLEEPTNADSMSSSAPPISLPHTRRGDATVMGLVGLAHCASHFSQLLLPPLFPWLKDAFHASYAELGVLLTVFFIVSCSVQALSGFIVDRFGPRPILFGGIALLAAAAFGFAASTSYAAMLAFAVVAGIGNGVFHPVDYTLLNRKIHPSRLGHAFSVHGITGSLGWALAPAMLVPIALAFSWRVALASAGVVVLVVLAVLIANRSQLTLALTSPAAPKATHSQGRAAASFGFFAIPAVWMCFGFFFLYAVVLGGIQAFAPEAARQLHAVPTRWAAMCLTFYMVAAACGMVVGGFLAADPSRCERIVAIGFTIAAVIALTIGFAPVAPFAVPVLFAAMGLAAGIAGPSRDLIVKRSAPENATGRVYGVVYSGLDIGQAFAPLLFAPLLDLHRPADVWLGIAIVQALMITTAVNVRRARRTALAPAAA